jgi:hypothetical protein
MHSLNGIFYFLYQRSKAYYLYVKNYHNYRFLGELYFNQDVGISNAVDEQITKVAIL